MNLQACVHIVILDRVVRHSLVDDLARPLPVLASAWGFPFYHRFAAGSSRPEMT